MKKSKEGSMKHRISRNDHIRSHGMIERDRKTQPLYKKKTFKKQKAKVA